MRIYTPRDSLQVPTLSREECLKCYKRLKEGCLKIYTHHVSSEKMKHVKGEDTVLIETIFSSDHLFLKEGIENDQLDLSVERHELYNDEDYKRIDEEFNRLIRGSQLEQWPENH